MRFVFIGGAISLHGASVICFRTSLRGGPSFRASRLRKTLTANDKLLFNGI